MDGTEIQHRKSNMRKKTTIRKIKWLLYQLLIKSQSILDSINGTLWFLVEFAIKTKVCIKILSFHWVLHLVYEIEVRSSLWDPNWERDLLAEIRLQQFGTTRAGWLVGTRLNGKGFQAIDQINQNLLNYSPCLLLPLLCRALHFTVLKIIELTIASIIFIGHS